MQTAMSFSFPTVKPWKDTKEIITTAFQWTVDCVYVEIYFKIGNLKIHLFFSSPFLLNSVEEEKGKKAERIEHNEGKKRKTV